MYAKKGGSSAPWLAPLRAVMLGAAASAAAGLFATACGALLCLAAGYPWTSLVWWSLRGAFAGLVAGATVGALSGVYHVNEPSPTQGAARGPELPRPPRTRAPVARTFTDSKEFSWTPPPPGT